MAKKAKKKTTNTLQNRPPNLSMEDASEIIRILGDNPLQNLKRLVVTLDMIEHGCWGHVNHHGKWKPGRTPNDNAKLALSCLPVTEKLKVLNEHEEEAKKY